MKDFQIKTQHGNSLIFEKSLDTDYSLFLFVETKHGKYVGTYLKEDEVDEIRNHLNNLKTKEEKPANANDRGSN